MDIELFDQSIGDEESSEEIDHYLSVLEDLVANADGFKR